MSDKPVSVPVGAGPLSGDALIRSLLWDEHPECCGSPVVGAEYMGQQEMVCCGCPEPALLNDAQIVATLRTRFPRGSAEPDALERAAQGKPPRLRHPGESVTDYRIAMGWDAPRAAT
jgi:hypothetical protein